VAAILHPSQQAIAYHFFWDDDIDFPDDNEPCDHELVWVRFGADGALTEILTYFHGRVLSGGERALKDAMTHGKRPFVAVQWGKHGSMPLGWQEQTIEPEDGETEAAFLQTGESISLAEYNRATFERLATEGARAADHPLARRSGWPRGFRGNAADFVSFTKPVDVLRLLREKRMIAVSRWNSAVINQQFLRYNFQPKLGWPSEADGSSSSKKSPELLRR
jgi:hypothetical protein